MDVVIDTGKIALAFFVAGEVGAGDDNGYLQEGFDRMLEPLVDLAGGFLGQTFGINELELPGLILNTHKPSLEDYDAGDDHLYLIAKTTKLGVPLLKDASVLVTVGKFEQDDDDNEDGYLGKSGGVVCESSSHSGDEPCMVTRPIVTLAVSFEKPHEMLKAVMFGLDVSVIFPSLRHIEMGFVVSTASKDLVNEAIPSDVEMPGIFAGRDAFSSNAAFIGTFPLSGVHCGSTRRTGPFRPF